MASPVFRRAREGGMGRIYRTGFKLQDGSRLHPSRYSPPQACAAGCPSAYDCFGGKGNIQDGGRSPRLGLHGPTSQVPQPSCSKPAFRTVKRPEAGAFRVGCFGRLTLVGSLLRELPEGAGVRWWDKWWREVPCGTPQVPVYIFPAPTAGLSRGDPRGPRPAGGPPAASRPAPFPGGRAAGHPLHPPR